MKQVEYHSIINQQQIETTTPTTLTALNAKAKITPETEDKAHAKAHRKGKATKLEKH